MIGVLLLALALINYHVNPSATEDLQKHKTSARSMNTRNVKLASTDKGDAAKAGGAGAQNKQAMFEAEERVGFLCCMYTVPFVQEANFASECI